MKPPALVSAETLATAAVDAAKDLAAQPAFQTVKQQLRGPALARLAELAASGHDPLAHELRGS